MRQLAAVFMCILLFTNEPDVLARTAASGHLSARHTTSAVTIRGVVSQLHGSTFTLKTTTHGNLHVVIQRATQITERKHRGSFPLFEGDHVGVHGFLNGSQFTAISIQIVPVKPKQFSVRGVVGSATSSQISITAAGKTYAVRVTGSTGLQVTNGPNRVLKNDHVLVRLEAQGSMYLALRIHVYSRKVAGKHIQLQGTLVSLAGSSLIVATGTTRTTVELSPHTTLHASRVSATKPKLAVGQRLTIHACCEGGPLTAISIHILVTLVTHSTQLLHGTVLSASTHGIVARIGGATVAVGVDGGTRVTLSGRSIGMGGIHAGDDVSIHAWKNGSRWQARSVLIHAASRAPRSLAGLVTGTRASTLIIERAGKQYTIVIDHHTSIVSGSKPIAIGTVRSGDRVRAHGVLSGTQLLAGSIQVTPAKATIKTVRGTIVQVTPTAILVTGDDGGRYQVRPTRGVRITLHGGPAPSAALTRGTRIHAKGYLSGSILSASSVSITVQSRTIQGRISRIASGRLDVESRSSTYVVDLPKGVVVADGGHTIAIGAVHVGAYARVAGYVEGTLALRAARVDIYHPHVSVVGSIASGGSTPTVRTTAGATYTLHLPSTLHISVSRLAITLTGADLATGMRVHAAGIVGTDGIVQVSQLSVRLTSLTVRGQLTGVESGALTVQGPDGTVRARITASTPVAQTSRVLKWNDLVAGDDVTIYGYRLSGSTMLTRRVTVHRQRTTLTGTVTSVTSDGFSVDAADGSHRVLTAGAVMDTPNGGAPAVGALVHVRGYLRGDGVVLATTVTVKAP